MRVLQECYSSGFGGLELVVLEFHQWLLSQNIEAVTAVLKGSRLEKEMLSVMPAATVRSFSDSLAGRYLARQYRQTMDSAQTAHLFHQHRVLKSLIGKPMVGPVSVLNHTFMSVVKKDILHQKIFENVDHWIALTPLHRLNLHEYLGIDLDRIHVIPNGVDLERFQPAPQPAGVHRHPVKAGVVARLDPQKGQDIAVRALADLRRRGVDIELYFYGEDTPNEARYSPYLKDLVKQLDVPKFVHFIGYEGQLQNQIPKLDFLWMTSHKETFGRCLIEAMACRVPVIASSAGGVVDIIFEKRNGILFETKDPKDLADKTEWLLANPAIAERIIDQAYRGVQSNYDQKKIWQKLYQCVTGNFVEATKHYLSLDEEYSRTFAKPTFT